MRYESLLAALQFSYGAINHAHANYALPRWNGNSNLKIKHREEMETGIQHGNYVFSFFFFMLYVCFVPNDQIRDNMGRR